MTMVHQKLKRWNLRHGLYFFVPLLLCVVLRSLYLAFFHRDPSFSVLILDAYRFQERALEILDGRLFTGRPFDMVPLYPFILAAVYKTAGVSLLLIRVLQLACGLMSGLLIYLIGKRAFDRAAGATAFLIYALYGVFPYYELHLLATAVSILFLLLFILLLLIAVEKNSAGSFALAGLAAGILVLLRPNFLPVMACVCLFLIYHRIRGREKMTPHFSVKHAALFIAVLCLCLAASMLFNFLSSGEYVLLTAHSGINFYIGNNPEADGTYVAVRGIGGSPVDQVADAAEMAETSLGRELKAAEVSAYWSGRALSFIREMPFKTIRLYAKKFLIFWNAYEVPSIADYHLGIRHLPVFFRGMVWFGLVSPLAFIGLIVLWKGRSFSAAFLYVIVLSYLAVLLLFYVNGRYRLPIVPVLILFASAYLKWLYVKIMDKKWRVLAPAVLCSALLFVLVHLNLPGLDTGLYEARGAARLGLVFISNQDYDNAVEALDEAIRLDPNDYKAYFDKGVALFLQGKKSGSEEHFQKAISLKPDCWEALHGLGNIALLDGALETAEKNYLEAIAFGGRREELLVSLYQVYRREDRWDAAAPLLEALITLQPRKPDYVLDLAEIHEKNSRPDAALKLLEDFSHREPSPGAVILKGLARLYGQNDRPDAAETILRTLLQSHPADADVHFRLAVLCHRQGRLDEALQLYRQAVGLGPENPLYHLNLGNVYAGLGDLKEAERSFTEALRLRPGMKQARANLAEIQKRLSRR